MAKTDYTRKVNSFIDPFLKKNGYSLIGSEFVSEDGNWFLRLYIDLSEEEYAKRLEELGQSESEPEEEEAEITAPAVNESSRDDDGECAAEASDSSGASDSTEADGGAVCTEADSTSVHEASGEEDTTDEDEVLTPGISINDCVKVSRYLSKWLDKEDFIKEAYTMEVCSRGFMNGGQLSASEEGEGE